MVLIRSVGQLQADPFDEMLRTRKLPDDEKNAIEKIDQLLSHLQYGLKGEVFSTFWHSLYL